MSCCWEEYSATHKIREVERREVEKALSCRSDKVFVYICTKCRETIYQRLGCNGRICSRCGKRYNDEWAKRLSRSMFKVPHRQFVLSIPEQLWPYLKNDRKLWKVYMDSAIETCRDYFPKIMHDTSIEPGLIVILHPFGRDMKFQPHLHIIVTEGGFNDKGNFISKTFFPARPFAKVWQYHVSKNFQEAGVPASLFTKLYAKYDGFYVWVHRAGRIKNPKDIAKYLGRYVRHPAISNSRIIGFDGTTVNFFYERKNDDGTPERYDVSMPVDEFISSLIQHIPDSQFKMVRHYGAYARKHSRRFRQHLQQSSIENQIQDTIYMPGRKFKPVCPKCGGFLIFSGYQTIPPPGDYFHIEINRENHVVWLIRN